MRITFRFILLLLPALLSVTLLFILGMQRLERGWVQTDLDNRARLVADSIEESLAQFAKSGNVARAAGALQRISRDPRLAGALICLPDGRVFARSESLDPALGRFVCPTNGAETGLISVGEAEFHRADFPVRSEAGTIATLSLFHDPSYMTRRGRLTRAYAIAAFLVLGLVISAVTLLIYRWSVGAPIKSLVKSMRSIMRGDLKRLPASLQKTELAPLVKNLDRVLRQLSTEKEAREDLSPNWTAVKLGREVKRLFGESRLCVVANREPYIHNRRGKAIEVLFPASGLVSAVEPIVRACSGLWIGHASGTADRETADANGVVLVPPGKPEYALKRVWLSPDEEQGYYYGFSNEGLWPLCHIAHTRPNFRASDWDHYATVNRKFADAFSSEMKEKAPIALIQDYHFALVPGILRETRPDAVTSLFWHIPWPNPESIGICPWKNELLTGMLGADLIGFHTQYHCNNFLDTVDRFLEARVDRDAFSVTIRGHTCYVKPFPISVEWPPRHQIDATEIRDVRAGLIDELGLSPDALIGIGVDRLDYTKGILERFLAVERLLEKYPEMVGRFVFVQIGAPSRTHIKRYQDLNSEVQEVTDRINWKFQRPGYEPIVLRMAHHNAEEVFRYYRAADVCIVSSLHDGMNLVAKEFISSRRDERGVLVLSSFTGAARELPEALIVNPYDIEETCDAIHYAVTMEESELRLRMSRLRETVAAHNVYAWAAGFLNEVHSISQLRSGRFNPASQGGY